LKSIKVTLQMDMLRCKTPEMVHKEIWTHVLAYNLIRTIMAQAAARKRLAPRSISFKGTLQTMTAFQDALRWATTRTRDRVFQAMLKAISEHRVGDRFGRKFVIWWSILGVLPFSILLPYASLLWTSILSVIIGIILASAFSAILVYAQDLIPTKIGTVSGLFFGLAFGLGGIGAALLGKLADHTSINFVYHVCSLLPALGILTAFLPNLSARRGRKNSA